MNYKELNGKTIREGFNEFNKENPHVYDAFEEQAIKAINKGRKKISSKLIINWIRWNEYLNSTDKNFKINDAYQSYYARHFVELNPHHLDAFNFRKLRNEDKSQYMEVDEFGQMEFI
mgnify:FL=1|tara:strand:+ start:1115 stop:1465 length:351 start_codon:yes stop_codon:yes gene_type:complete